MRSVLRVGCVVLALTIGGASVLQGQPRPDRRKPKVVTRALCVVRNNARVECVGIEDLRRQLSPEMMDRIHQMIADILEDFGLGSGKNTLFGCNREWRTANVTLPPPSIAALPRGSRAAPTARAWPAASDVQNMVSQCRQSVRGDIEAGIRQTGVGRSEWVSQTVAQMDKAVAGCQDRTSPVAAGWSTWPEDLSKARGDYAAAKEALIEEYTAAEVVAGDPKAVTAYARLSDAEALKKIIESELDRNATNRNAQERETKRNFLIEMLQELAKEVQEIVETPIPATPVPENPSTQPQPTPAPAPTQPPTSGSTPCDPDTGCKPSCEQIQARWSAFKSYCEESNWQAYQCEAFLRTANGCVDMTLINPGPEGDMTCPTRAKVDKMKESYLAACRKRKWVSIPSGDTDILCVAPDFDAARPGIDPCNNPRVLPDPDRCGGAAPLPGEDRPPKPDPVRPRPGTSERPT
jgi:hypothetical protein